MPGDNQNTAAEGAKAQQYEQELNRSTQTVGDALQEETQEKNERVEQLSKEQADRLYEERMEEEYAKREGGA